MLHVVDALLPDALRLGLRELCEAHAALKQRHHGDALFSWRPERGQGRSLHRPEHQRLIERYLVEHLLPLARPFAGAMDGVDEHRSGEHSHSLRRGSAGQRSVFAIQ